MKRTFKTGVETFTLKEEPWYDTKLLSHSRQKEISDLGFNVVRLGAMWTGTEPKEDVYNKTYIDILEVIFTLKIIL